MGKMPLYLRNPWHPRANYTRQEKHAICRAKLERELMGGRKPTAVQKLLLDQAGLMILDLRDVQDAYCDRNKPLPKNYYTRQARLLAIIGKLHSLGFKGKRAKPPKGSAPAASGLDLANIIQGGGKNE
eukprot:TRINITY_DN135361_c0_g1_i1.p3 TRINITY_DN135361_c0_g1~~TRINITY_DN135361_c0_g1_i1.p3  ORF type:complete len:128 (+),score=29.57 TRINITY_DN135361_c0_g1_i1:23-406(+)